MLEEVVATKGKGEWKACEDTAMYYQKSRRGKSS